MGRGARGFAWHCALVCVGPADGLRDGAAQYQCAYCAVLLSTPFRSAEPIAAGDRGPLYYIGWERHSPGPEWVHCRLLGEWFVLVLIYLAFSRFFIGLTFPFLFLLLSSFYSFTLLFCTCGLLTALSPGLQISSACRPLPPGLRRPASAVRPSGSLPSTCSIHPPRAVTGREASMRDVRLRDERERRGRSEG